MSSETIIKYCNSTGSTSYITEYFTTPLSDETLKYIYKKTDTSKIIKYSLCDVHGKHGEGYYGSCKNTRYYYEFELGREVKLWRLNTKISDTEEELEKLRKERDDMIKEENIIEEFIAEY